jgi:hypothetical protein
MERFVIASMLLLVCGCSAAGEDIQDDVVVNPDLVHEQADYDAEKRGTAPCGFGVDPDPELYDFVFEAQERWFAATGCMIDIDPDGIPMHVWDHVFIDEAGGVYDVDPQLEYRETCGVTRRNNDGSAKDIYVSWTDHGGCRLTTVVPHELGHVWSPPGQHAESGVMASGKDPDRSPLIDENTLAWTCQKLDCQTFNPERSP